MAVVSVTVLLRMDLVYAQSEAQAAAGPPVSIALLANSDSTSCYDSGHIAAIRRLAALEPVRKNVESSESLMIQILE